MLEAVYSNLFNDLLIVALRSSIFATAHKREDLEKNRRESHEIVWSLTAFQTNKQSIE